jgi:serine phosphatase RsbU (regulator of sigma subunit)
MSDLAHPVVTGTKPGELAGFREWIPSSSILREGMASNRSAWLPPVFVLAAIAAVAYADHLVVVPSLIYLYILPLSMGAIFLRKEISYGLSVACILFHYFNTPRHIPLGVRIFHDLSALLCFTFVIYVIQRYAKQQESLLMTVELQRDDLLRDVELAAEVQRLFLPSGKAAMGGLEIAGRMQPARGVSGDYFDYFPLDGHTTQIVIADVVGKGVPAALLMSATAAAMRLEANHDRNMIKQVERLNMGIHSVSDSNRFVTLLLAEIDAQNRTLRYVNCGHNPALLFRAATGMLSHLNSSCLPIGLAPKEDCELASENLTEADVLVFYTDGVTEAENSLGEEFGMDRLSAVVRRGSSLSAEDLMITIFDAAADFCGNDFNDDVTILVVKCDFGDFPTLAA